MKKNASSKIILNPKRNSRIGKIQEKLALRPNSSTSRSPFYNNTNIKYNDSLPLFHSPSNSEISFFKTQPKKKQLYEETLQLKKEVNELRAKISLAKSENRKKDVEISQKSKVIDEVMSNIQTSNNLDPVSLDKLRDTNSLTKLKKEFYQLKNIHNIEVDKKKALKEEISTCKPNNIKFMNETLSNQLAEMILKFQKIQSVNEKNMIQIRVLEENKQKFQKNHELILSLQSQINEKKENMKILKKEVETLGENLAKNKERIAKQNLQKEKIEKHNITLLNTKKQKEGSIKNRTTHENTLKKLREELEDCRSTNSGQNNMIKKLSDTNFQLEDRLRRKTNKLYKFKFNSVSNREVNPQQGIDQRVLLLKSLINESLTNRRKYLKEINELIEALKSNGVDVSLIEDGNGNISERNIVDDSNSGNIFIEEKKIVGNEKTNDKEGDISKDSKDSKISKNSKSLKPEKTNKEEDKEEEKKEEERKEEDKKEEEKEEDKKEDKNQDKEEEPRKNSEPSRKIQSISKPSKSEPNDPSEPNNDAHEAALAEFTYVLIKNLEAKKITFEVASQKLVEPKDDYVKSLQTQILALLNCKNSTSSSQLKSWLEELLKKCQGDSKKAFDTFMSIFSNIKLYTQEEEKILEKKVKKNLLPYKEKIQSKLSELKKDFISYLVLKEIMENLKIQMKDDYAQYLFYKMKQFDEPDISLYDLKVKNLIDIYEDNANDSLMNTESDIEITNEEYVRIITEFVGRLKKALKDKNTTIREVLKNIIEIVKEEDTGIMIEVIPIDLFVNTMKAFGVELKTEVEMYCIYTRYKISDDYEVISMQLLEKELNTLDTGKVGIPQTGKIMENVEEENESNISL